MQGDTLSQTHSVSVTVDPGICGFKCRFQAFSRKKKTVHLKLMDSECEHIQRLVRCLDKVSLQELFTPINRNPVFVFAQQAGCHPSCPIPMAIVKGAEVVLDLALPQNVNIELSSND
jgi:hypothetical protein